jgi:hypothetical protein
MAKKTNRFGRRTNGTLKLYKSYMFRTKDPAIDLLRTIVQDTFGTGKAFSKGLYQIERDGGPSHGAMNGWFYGKVKRPQNATLEAAGRAMGYERVWRKQPKDKE